MSEELSKDEYMENVLNVCVRSEVGEGEKLLVSARPDTGAMNLQLLCFPLFLMIGLFLFSVGVLTGESAGDGSALGGMIFLLVLVAIVGVVELVAIPYQARRSIYIVTNLRTVIIKLRGKFGYRGMDDYSIVSRKLIRPEKGTMFSYFAYTLPIHLLFLYLIVDLVFGLVDKFNPYALGGFVVILFGWLFQWYQDSRYPLPQFRECPRAFYFINEWLASVESVKHDIVSKVVYRKGKSGTGDIFLVAKGMGCLRLKAVPDAQDVYEKIETSRDK